MSRRRQKPAYPPKPPGGDNPGWTVHTLTDRGDGAVGLDPPMAANAFGSIHIWSVDLDQWVKPTLLNFKPGQLLATKE